MKRASMLLALVVCVVTTPTARADVAPRTAVRAVFAPEGHAVAEQAIRVAGCESAGDPTGRALRPYATNGQYLGLFQLGSWARSRYLHGPWYSAWANARAALSLYRANERSWRGQWECSWAAYR